MDQEEFQKENSYEKKHKLTLDVFLNKKKENKKIDFIKTTPQKENINSFKNNSRNSKLLITVTLFFLLLGILYAFGLKNVSFDKKQDFSAEQINFNEFLKNLGFNQKNLKDTNIIFDKFGFFLNLLKNNLFLSKDFIVNFYGLYEKSQNILDNFSLILKGEFGGKILRQNFIDISNYTNNLKNIFANSDDLKKSLGEGDYFYFYNNLNKISNFLDNLISLLDKNEKYHFLVLFLNNSEIRPGGGFLGSYADIAIYNWKIESIKVLDINEPDKEFKQKIIPPYALQDKVYSWKAADANWFLDFASSSSKVISFLESSDFYKKDNVKFIGVAAVTPQVAADLLEILGPVEIEKNLVLNKDNFLTELQKIIEENRAEKEKNPKVVLNDFLNKVLDKMTSLGSEQKNQILNKFFDWVAYKDIAFYSSNKEIQSFFDFYNLTPRITKLNNDFFGDYLAVVDANAASGKSDVFIKKSVNIEIQISNNGTLSNSLEIIRKNNVLNNYSWWYKRINEDYVNIFIPRGAEILKAEGGESKKIIPLSNYSKEGFIEDNYLGYEKTLKKIIAFPQINIYDFGDKNIFSTWLKTAPGEIKKIKLDYIRRLPTPPLNNKKFVFILDRQIADSGDYNIKIQAPIGFYFKENNLPVFEYKTTHRFSNLLIIELTLISE